MKRRVIGRADKVDLPLLGLNEIDVKVDTGADSCSVHCHNIELIDEGKKVRFNLLDPNHPEYNEKEFVLDVARITSVKSSTGLAQNRVFIKSEIVLFGERCEAEISLADRKNMKYPMLLGRHFLKDRFLVDVSRKNLSYKHKKREEN